MALSSLRHDHDAKFQENKSGYLLYDGASHNFHEWEFRVNMRLATTKPDDKLKVVGQIVDCLRGDAHQTAMDIGMTKLRGDEGIKTLVEGIRKLAFPMSRHEAKTLLKVGQNTKGVMSRQKRESMLAYISRRRRWWSRVKLMDPKVAVSEDMLGDWLLDSAGITYDQQRMVMTSTANSHEFQQIATALVEQHGNIHTHEGGNRDTDHLQSLNLTDTS